MTTRYRLDAGQSCFTVQAFATGLLSFMGHSPTFAVREFSGAIWFDPSTLGDAGLEITIPAAALDLTDKVRPADRKDIMDRMQREVLEIATFPDVRFQAAEVALKVIDGNRHRARISGSLTLHGVTNRHTVEAELLVYPDGVRLTGAAPLRLSDYRIRPVIALAGAIKLQDQLRVAFDMVAWKEEK
jgi:polyisoprenoid-binding protein YceI